MDDYNYKLRRNLVALFKKFKDKPETLAKYMCEYGGLTETFMDRIVNNKDLDEFAKRNVDDMPYFRDLREMMEYYNNIFTGDENKEELDSKVADDLNHEECLKRQLKEALDEQDFNRASYLRDYMKSLNINYNPYNEN